MFLLKSSCICRGFFYAGGICHPGIGSFVIFYYKEDLPGCCGRCIDSYYSIRSRYHQLGDGDNGIAGINGPHIINEPPAFPGNMNGLHTCSGIHNSCRNACRLKYSAIAVSIPTGKGKRYWHCLHIRRGGSSRSGWGFGGRLLAAQ